jgi:hypothetical protein
MVLLVHGEKLRGSSWKSMLGFMLLMVECHIVVGVLLIAVQLIAVALPHF